MPAKKMMSVILIGLLGLLALSSLYTIREGQRGLLLRLGKLVTDPKTGMPVVKEPGLHFKWPFVNRARVLDVRLQTLGIESSRYMTAKKKDVWVDSYVKWRIADLALYYTRTGGNAFRAEALLKQLVNDGLRAEFGKRDIQEVVSGERTDIMALLRREANIGAKKLGIHVVDVRIKGIDLPEEVSNAVFDRMRAERERSATEHRAKGRAAAEAIRAEADATVTVTVATAESNAKKVRAKGNAIAAEIYTNAYTKDKSFFVFYRSLIAYDGAFKDNDILVLRPDNQFFKYFNRAGNNNTNSKAKA